MTTWDYAIIGFYLLGLLVAGIWLSKRARQSSSDYFLAGRTIPWWALGCSGMASNLDVAGTMTIVAMISLYGLHGLFIEMRGGVVLPIAVFLAFMGKWHRRSEVMTTAEWMVLRFGEGAAGRLARTTAALTYIIITVAMIVFFLAAGGKFLAAFLPFSPDQCSLGMAVITFGYTLAGGLYGVIWTDVFQAVIIAVAAVYVSVIGALQISPELMSRWPGQKLNSFVPHVTDPLLEPYNPFWLFLVLWAGKGILEGLGGSGGSAYMAQRFYAAKSETDCRKIGMLWTVLFAVRWPMVLGFCLLALRLRLQVHGVAETETILPQVLNSEFFPAGVRGLVIAAMMAAAMSTFDSTINAGASYIVRDLYQPWRPEASQRTLVWAGYIASALIMVASVWIALSLRANVLTIWVGIVMLLFPAFLIPFALRWFWGRFNGQGFAGGVLAGFATAAWLSLERSNHGGEATRFLLIAGSSAIASVTVAIATRPVDPKHLENFYRSIRPFGFWPKNWKQAHRAEHRQDLSALGAALVWQLLTFLIPMGAMLSMWTEVGLSSAVWLVLGLWLWRGSKERSKIA